MAADRVRAVARQLRVGAGTVRVRTTAAAVAVVAVALLLGATALVATLQLILTREINASADRRAAEVAQALESGVSAASLAVTDNEDLFIQIVDQTGRVVAASQNMTDRPAVATPRAGESARVAVPFDDSEFLVVGRSADGLTVIVGRSLDPVVESTHAVGALLAIGIPIMLLVVGATSWRMGGRALAPVEAIRREVDVISATELHRRVPQPPGSDEIARLAVTMNRMLDRLESSQARQRRLVSDASHELRSPVAAIREHAEVALAYPGITAVADLAATVKAETLRLQHLVDDLLLLAHTDEHSLRLRRHPVDLDDLVFEEARRLRAATTLRVDTTAVSAGRVNGDGAALRRVLRNLADNAARYATSRVTFALSERDGSVRFDLDDDGPGIAAEDRARVFERFVRLDDARTRDAGGSGLGLAIVAELVAAHGGRVAVEDSPLGGTRVSLRLPGPERRGEFSVHSATGEHTADMGVQPIEEDSS